MSELERWNERYQAGDIPWDTGHPSSELQRSAPRGPDSAGAGHRAGLRHREQCRLARTAGLRCHAVDFSPLAIERARSRAADAGVRVNFVAGDVLALPDLGAPFSFFFDRGCYHVVRRTDVQGYLHTLERLTVPGSVGLVLAGNAREPHDPGPPVVSEEQIRAELGSVCQIVRLREFRFDQTPEVPVRFLGWSCLLRR